METIISKIQKQFDTLTPGQQKVARFLFDNIKEALVLNTSEIAERVAVSEATITRFIKSLGFSSLFEFRKEVGQALISNSTTTAKLSRSADTFKEANSLFEAVVAGDIENQKFLLSGVKASEFNEAVNQLCQASHICILGLRSSFSLAFYLYFNLRFHLKSVQLVQPGIGDLPEQFIDASPGCLLFGITFRRYTNEVLSICEMMKSRGIYIIGVTDHDLSPLAQIADIALKVRTNIPTYIESYTAPMSLINALIAAVALKNKDSALSALSKLENEFKVFKTYHS